MLQLILEQSPVSLSYFYSSSLSSSFSSSSSLSGLKVVAACSDGFGSDSYGQLRKLHAGQFCLVVIIVRS